MVAMKISSKFIPINSYMFFVFGLTLRIHSTLFFLQINNSSCSEKQLWIHTTTCIILTETVSLELVMQSFQSHIWATHNIGKEKLSCKERQKVIGERYDIYNRTISCDISLCHFSTPLPLSERHSFWVVPNMSNEIYIYIYFIKKWF